MALILDRRRIAVFLAGATAFLDMYCTQALLPDLAAEFGASAAAVALTVTMATLATALVAPLVGGFADMVGRKRVIIAGALLLVLPTIGLCFAPDLKSMLILRFLQGLCMPAIFTVTVAYVGEEWPAAEMPEVIGLYTAGTALGGVSGRLITAIAAEHLGWRDAFLVLGATNLAAALAIWACLPPAKNFRSSGSLLDTLSALWGHARNPKILATCGVGFTVLFTLCATFTYATFHLSAAPFNLSTMALGFIFVVYLLGVISAPLGGKLIARYGRFKAASLAAAFTITGILITLIPNLVVIMLGFCLLATGVFITQTASMSMISASATKARTAAVGLYVTTYYVGGSVGAWAPGLYWQQTLWPGPVFAVVGVVIVGWLLALLAWRK